MKFKKKYFFLVGGWVVGSGGGGGWVWGQGGWERRSEAFVKIQKKIGAGVGVGLGGVRVAVDGEVKLL